MLDGFWTVRFSSNVGDHGGGVVFLKDGKVLGGDSGFTYTGTYSLDGDNADVSLRVRQFVRGHHSVFGDQTDFELRLQGQVSGDQAKLKGPRADDANMRLTVSMQRQQDLP